MKSILYFIDLNFAWLTLGIGNLMSSHSLSAGHMPLGTGRDIHSEYIKNILIQAATYIKFDRIYLRYFNLK